MSPREVLKCECGGQIGRPIPPKCPHCGAVITRVRRRLWPRIYAVLIVAILFALLAAFLLWHVGSLSGATSSGCLAPGDFGLTWPGRGDGEPPAPLRQDAAAAV